MSSMILRMTARATVFQIRGNPEFAELEPTGGCRDIVRSGPGSGYFAPFTLSW